MKIENLLNIYVSKKISNIVEKYFYLDNSIKEENYMKLQKINYHPFYKYFKYFYFNSLFWCIWNDSWSTAEIPNQRNCGRSSLEFNP